MKTSVENLQIATELAEIVPGDRIAFVFDDGKKKKKYKEPSKKSLWGRA